MIRHAILGITMLKGWTLRRYLPPFARGPEESDLARHPLHKPHTRPNNRWSHPTKWRHPAVQRVPTGTTRGGSRAPTVGR
jgi:hypothetical protein